MFRHGFGHPTCPIRIKHPRSLRPLWCDAIGPVSGSASGRYASTATREEKSPGGLVRGEYPTSGENRFRVVAGAGPRHTSFGQEAVTGLSPVTSRISLRIHHSKTLF